MKNQKPYDTAKPSSSHFSSEAQRIHKACDEISSSDSDSMVMEQDFNNDSNDEDVEAYADEKQEKLEGVHSKSTPCCEQEVLDTEEEEHSDSDDSDSSDEEAENEEWDGAASEFINYMETASTTPIEEPPPRSSSYSMARSLVTWMLYFLVVWQTAVHLSDNGLEWLLRFFSQFFSVVGLKSDFVAGIAAVFPGSLYLMRKCLGIDRDMFTRYIVCPKCTKLYKSEECTRIINGRQVAQRCTNMLPFRKRKVECGHQLVKEVNSKRVFYPLKVYCYRGIIETLEKYVKRDGFAEKCELWRAREMGEQELADIYDGQVWKDFLQYKGEPYLSRERNYGLMLNCYWFQSYKHRNDFSVGVLYLVLMNLPRSERFKKENIFLVGIIPALKKEPASLNEFLCPMVQELISLWTGIKFVTHSSPLFPLKFRAALLCASSDIPAARKLCGFLSHSARLGCSRCFKTFPGGFSEKNDYSGFDRESWEMRTDKEQRRRVKTVLKAKSKAQKAKEERRLGVRFTALLKLPYYDSIRFCVIDPMHNLFLGTAKSMFKLWVKKEILTANDLMALDQKITEMNVVTDVGRIPSKISSKCGSFTAEEWKNWTMMISMYALNGVLPDEHIKCWQTFVLACRTLCRPFINTSDIKKGDFLLIKFCKEFEYLYGKESVKSNMHLHCHLKECMLDYGPLYGFWCFSFERYNGLLGGFKTNNHSPEIQIMRKFNAMTFCNDFEAPELYKDEFLLLISREPENALFDNDGFRNLYKAASCRLQDFIWDDISLVKLPGCFIRGTLNTDDIDCLKSVYTALYPLLDLSASVLPQVIKKYGIITLGTDTYGSKMSCRSLKSARIRASYAGSDGTINSSSFYLRPGYVDFFFSHELKINNKWKRHVFAVVNWYLEHPNKEYYSNPTELWQSQSFELGGPLSFMPVQRIYGKFAASVQVISNVDGLVVCPVPYKVYL